MSQSYCNLLYHLVFSTKNRQDWLRGESSERTQEYLGGAIRSEGGVAIIVSGTSNHVHILAKLRQDRAMSNILCRIKSNSSGWIHRTFPSFDQFSWQDGYGAFTVSPSQVEKVYHYIRDQEEHHRKVSFEEELVALLKAHGIEYEEKYLWR